MSIIQLNSYKEVDVLLDSAKFPEAIEKMRSWNKVWIYQFYETYPRRHIILQHSDFNSYWAEKRSALYSKAEFKVQNNLSDSDFVLGYIYYLIALAKQKEPQVFTAHLNKAIKFHSIHAAQTLFSELLKEPNDAAKLVKIKDLLDSVKTLATKHGTPGYLLLANIHLHWARITAELKDYPDFNKACTGLWENITLAGLEEENSTAAIYNAYFGQGLVLSNPLGISTIAQLKEKASLLIIDNGIKDNGEKEARTKIKIEPQAASMLTWLQSRNQPKSPEPDDSPYLGL